MNRREFLEAGTSASAMVALGLVGACREEETVAMDRFLRFYVGTYTRDGSEGIYRARMNAETGELVLDGSNSDVVNPSFLALAPNGRFLYAVNEIGDYEGRSSGSVTAFAVDPTSGGLEKLNAQPSMGAAPAHLVVDRSGRFVLTANYTGGNVSVLPIREDGSLDPTSDVKQHEGSGPNSSRQSAPHAHSVNLDPENRFALVADLGIDKVMVYRFDAEAGTLTPAPQPSASLRPGAGPRHLAFHPNGRLVYVINELDSTITAFDYDPDEGALLEIQTFSTLPDGFEDRSSCADIHVSPDGRFVYGSNRGHDSIVVYEIAPDSGSLVLIQHQSTLGSTPRNFTIDPTGRFLLAANQESRSVVSFHIDADSGMLTPSGHQMNVPVPVCLMFAPAGAGLSF